MKYPSDRVLFINGVKSGKLDFPYKRYFTSQASVKQMFEKLKRYNYKDRLMSKKYRLKNVDLSPQFKGKYMALLSKPSDYEDFNQLSDIFQEECRMKCHIFNNTSPYQFFRNHPDKIFDYCLKKYKKITIATIRETIYELHPECTSFRPTNIMAMIQMFKATHILDFSAGWGDRLIGALASGVDYYCGIDPNACLHPNYQKMIKFFNRSTKQFKMIKSPFQTTKITKKPYDLVFTCPPYFDMETYSYDNDQSISSHKEQEAWYRGFLKASVEKAWKVLISGGYMVLVLNQRNDQNYVERIVEFITTQLNSTYLGVISYSDSSLKNPQPMWIWKKK